MVPGEGPLPALGLVLGEAPGPVEVEQKRPFRGPSGVLLDQALALLDLDRSKLYVTNVVKVWPRDTSGRTRRPNEEEIKTWRPTLELEIEQCSPAAMLFLGVTVADSMRYALGDEEMPAHFAAWHPGHVGRYTGFKPKGEKFAEWLKQLEGFAQAVHDAADG